MENYQDLVDLDEDDLLEELPEKSIRNDKDDSGLEISDSVEIIRENVEQHFLEEIDCESNHGMESNNKQLPGLVLLPPNQSYQEEKLASSLNTSHSEILPELQPISEMPQEEVNPSESSSYLNNTSRRSSTSSFIDSLLDKLRRNNNSDSSGSEFSPTKRPSKEPKSSDEDLLVEINSPVSYVKPTNPNMLPTPIVKNQSISSVFVNSAKEYEEVVERTKHKSTLNTDDRAKMTNKSLPPRMTAPKLPSNIQHPRTLAQKRQLMNSNLGFLIIEQESKIFKQIQRKMADRDLNKKLINNISEDDIPIKHGPWKALSWLRTEEGNYIQQYITVDERTFKIGGSRGNHQIKLLPSQSSKPFPKFQKTSLRSVRCCEGGKIKKRLIDNLVNVESFKRFVLEESLSPFRKIEISLYNRLSSIKPRPLSKKIEFMNSNRKLMDKGEDSVFLGDYVKYKMPDVKLVVKPQRKVPLDTKAKEYLNELLPHRDMNENWINFSLSTLSTKEEPEEEQKESFEFHIPYADNKQHILAREISKTACFTDILVKGPTMSAVKVFDKEMKWTFDKNCDKDDPVEMEVVEIIKDLTNSVCINLNDDLFTKMDTIERTSVVVAPIKAKEAIENIASTSKNIKPDQSKKILLELRRLNANVVKSDATRVDDNEDIRRHALAHLAKDERELRPTVIVTDSDTVLLSNKTTETRRQKRAPKRYSDYMHSENIESNIKEAEYEPPKKVTPKELVDQPFKTRAQYTDVGLSHEEIKKIKEEAKKCIHVNVELMKLENLEQVQPWCMVHNLYKCSCRKTSHERIRVSSEPEHNKISSNKDENVQEAELDESTEVEESSVMEVDECMEIAPAEDEYSRRVLPVDLDKARKSICEFQDSMDIEDENKENAPKMDILNLSELINGGIGPIYINIYDTKVNRLNPIFRSILNNKSALVYVDGLGYYLDMKKIDVMKLKFENIREELEHPVFIIRPKVYQECDDEKVYDDFVNLLFKEDSDLLLQIKDKYLLKTVANIIETVLQSVRRKIETQIGCEPSDFVKEQLSLITRDRSNSNTSVSSADTSPLTFNGKALELAPSPGSDSDLMKEFNQIFSMRMQRLCAIIRSNTLGLHLLDGYVNKFYIYKWSLLLQSYEEDLISIWQVKLTNESESYYNYVITNSMVPPVVETADPENVINIKNLALNSTAVLIKMILLRVENSNTKNMTVLLFGCQGYFRVCGVLNSKENYFDRVSARPTKQTHPRLTAKIQKVYNIWYGLKKAKAAENMRSRQSQLDAAIVPKIDSEEKKMEIDEEVHKVENSLNETKVQGSLKQRSMYKWFLFNISNDFSDIFIKKWKNYLPYNVIMDAINKAKAINRAVRILGPLNSAKDSPKIFALSKAPLNFKKVEKQSMTDNFLLFGPYLRNSYSNLLLMQNVNGQMLLRDEFEKKNNIKRASRTRCLWIYADSLKCVADTQIESLQPAWNRESCGKVNGT